MLFRWGGECLLGVISFGGCLCFSGSCTSSLALCVFGVLRCLGCLEKAGPVELGLFLLICLLFAPPHIMSFVILFVCWFPMSQLILIWDWESVASCNLVLTWFGVSLVYWDEGCPSDLVLKSGGTITFDSWLRVSSLAQVWFWAFYGFFRSIGGR